MFVCISSDGKLLTQENKKNFMRKLSQYLEVLKQTGWIHKLCKAISLPFTATTIPYFCPDKSS